LFCVCICFTKQGKQICPQQGEYMKKSTHVVPGVDGGWDVEDGGKKVGHYKTQKDAIASATTRGHKEHTEVVIHGRDGKIREKNSFGNDPYPPKG
jgi:hypothetical protein